MIVSVHPLMQHIPLGLMKRKGLLGKLPFVTVVTDLDSCHPTWFHPDVNRCFIPSLGVVDRAHKMGLTDEQITHYGLPLRPAFSKAVLADRGDSAKSALRHELGLEASKKTVLLIGGGEGMGPVAATAGEISKNLSGLPDQGQLIVICGKNVQLKEKLEATSWPDGVSVKVEGFVDATRMASLMSSSNVIVTKAGPGTIAEAMACSLPIVLNDFIPGQEAGNVSFVVDSGAGTFVRDPAEVASTIGQWFSDPSLLRGFAQGAASGAKPEATYDIARDIADIVRSYKT